MKYDLCKDNEVCCDDNCQRCAQLIYNKYMELKAKLDMEARDNKEYKFGSNTMKCDFYVDKKI